MHDLIFVSAQPDNVYFHWQVELYLYQFAKQGIKDKCYAVFGYTGNKPSAYIQNLAKRYNVVWYQDTRTNKNYIPSIRPHVLKKFFKEYPNLGKNVFYHDSDIFIQKLPPFEEMLKDDVAYLSDTVSYIGYNYIADCSRRYKSKYPELLDDDIFTKMCECVDIPEQLVKENQKNSGGAQYLLKNVSEEYWAKSEESGIKLYDMLKKYEQKYPIDHHIQSWTAGMWAELWEYWKQGKKTQIHSELDFSWATNDRKAYHSKNIFHLAGVTESSPKNIFFKGKYINRNVLEDYKHNKQIFDNISSDSATIEYTNMIKELVDSKPSQNSLVISTTDFWSGVYEKDPKTIHFERNVWRSTDKKFILFWNSSCWILTASQHESEISETCGGFTSFSSIDQFFI
jgi:hypothetical protein